MGVGFSATKIVSSVTEYVSGVKRKRDLNEDEEIQKVIDIALHTPKRYILLMINNLYWLLKF